MNHLNVTKSKVTKSISVQDRQSHSKSSELP